MNINEKILILRSELALSQQQFGYKIGVTQQVVAKWESGKCQPNATSIIAIYKAYNIEPNELLGLEDEFGTKNNETVMTTDRNIGTANKIIKNVTIKNTNGNNNVKF